MLPVLSNIKDFKNPFLLSVYSSTRSEEMKVIPWTEEQKEEFLRIQFEAQHNHYLQKFPAASYQIINFNNNPVGRFYVERRTSRIKILDITILPEFRGKGIGAYLIREILEEAAADEKSVEIYIENFNLSANLFLRLGFQPVSEEGIHVLWKWDRSQTAASAVGA